MSAEANSNKTDCVQRGVETSILKRYKAGRTHSFISTHITIGGT